MKRSEELFDRIDNYISGSLSNKEKSDFINELSNNEELRIELKKHEHLKEILSNKKVLQFNKELKSISEEIKEENRKRLKLYKYSSIAALFLIFITLITLLTVQNHTNVTTLNDLYLKNYTPFHTDGVMRSANSENSSEIKTMYIKGQYDNLIMYYEKMNNPLFKNELDIYIGCAYLSSNKPQKAILIFKKTTQKSSYYEDAKWYLICSYLKTNQKEKVLENLEKLIKYNGRYLKKAKKLYKKVLSVELK